MDKLRIFLDHPPPIRVRHGVVHVEDTGGGFECEHTCSIETMASFIERGQRVLARYRAGERDIYEGD